MINKEKHMKRLGFLKKKPKTSVIPISQPKNELHWKPSTENQTDKPARTQWMERDNQLIYAKLDEILQELKKKR